MNDSNKTQQANENKSRLNILAIICSSALLICCFSLALISIRIEPLSRWANYQDICIDETSKTYPIAYSVRKCNGRSKIYMK